MKSFKLFFCAALFSCFALNAQIPSLQQSQLFPDDLPYLMTSFRILGAKEVSGNQELYFSFKHPNGGVQSNLGAFSSGGREAETLEGFGKITINADGTADAGPVTWMGESKLVGSATYYARPLAEAKDMTQDPLASKDEIVEKNVLRDLRRELTKLPQPELTADEKPAAPAIDYVEEYFNTIIYIGLSGGLSQVLTVTYTLKPEEDWDKGLNPKPYYSKNSINKKGVDAAFGDSKISYKGFFSRKINDPKSGNAIALGGLKYKKDKTKDNSHFYEFRLLAFNKEGELFNSDNLVSDEPLGLESVQPIYGDDLAPEIKEVTHAIFVLKGDGNRKVDGINKMLRRFVLVDMKTGEILSNTSAELLQPTSIPFEARHLDNGSLAMGYYYPTAGEEGFTYLIVDRNGNITREEFGNNTYQLSGLTLPNEQFMRMKISNIRTYAMENGGKVELREFKKESGSEANGDYRATPVQTAFFVYDEDNKLVKIQKAIPLYGVRQAKLLHQEGNVLTYYSVSGVGKSKQPRFTVFDLDKLEITSIAPPADYFLVTPDAHYQNKDERMVYFLCRGVGSKGLHFFSMKY